MFSQLLKIMNRYGFYVFALKRARHLREYVDGNDHLLNETRMNIGYSELST